MEAFITKASLIATLALQVLILILLIKRRLHRRFFWFLAYIVYELVESSLRLAVSGDKSLYWTVFWWTEIGDVSLTLLAFGESFLNTFREYTRLRLFVVVVWSCIGAALLYAFFKALVFPPVQANRRGTIIIDLELAINFAVVILGILYLGLKALFKIRGRQWESGIVAGFGIYSVSAILKFLMRSIFGTRFPVMNTWIRPTGYLLAEIIWAVEFSRAEEKPTVPKRNLTVDDLTKLEQYSRVLERFLGRKA
jgi:hypothetical protein